MENGTYKIRVLHNEGRDHFFGYDPATADLYLVHTYDVSPIVVGTTDPIALANDAFMIFNVGDDPEFCNPPHPEAVAYRAKRLRSLSVGDVILIEDADGERHFMACENLGWDEIEEARQVGAGPIEDDPMWKVAHGRETLDDDAVADAVERAMKRA